MKLGKKLAEGKTKIVYESENPNEVILEFKDDITAGDGLKHDVISGKGYLNCAISSKIFEIFEDAGVPTHYVKYIPPNYMVVKTVTMVPVELVCRNIAAGHLLQRFPVEADEGKKLDKDVCWKGGYLGGCEKIYVSLYRQLLGEDPKF